jgi:pectate lyase
MRTTLLFFFGLVAIAASPVTLRAEQDVPAFPGAEGFGAYAKGGRGGRVIAVTNLKDYGPEEKPIPGSFRAACEAKGPRLVVFRVSGTLTLKAPLYVIEPHLTLAGQTAPGDGFCLRGNTFGVGRGSLSTHDVIVRHLRFRCGPGRKRGHEPDGMAINNARDVIFDHCSITWGVDEVLSITAHPMGYGRIGASKERDFDPKQRAVTENISVQWCILAEGLNRSTHPKGAHSKGPMIAYGPSKISLHHNLIAHSDDRNPYLPAEGELPFIVDIRNNLVYNWGQRTAVSYPKINHNGRLNFVGNRYLPGPNSRHRPSLHLGVKTRVFLRDNLGTARTKPTDPERKAMSGVGRVVDEPFDVPPVTTHAAEELPEVLLPAVGATAPRRDAADRRLVDEVKTGKGRIIDHPKQVGGWPALKSTKPPKDSDGDGMPDAWEKKHGLDPKNPKDAARRVPPGASPGDRHAGYTWVEFYINQLADRKKPTP